MNDTSKPTNPKQAFADTKTPVAVMSGAMELWDCLGFLEGLLKYGRANFRVSGVRVSTYMDAARRHLLKFAEGEWCAEDTQVPHLVSVRACVGIILDAFTASRYPVHAPPALVGGKFLTDDRIPSVDVSAVERETARISNHLRDMFKDREPRHCTIEDTHVVYERGSAPADPVGAFHDSMDSLCRQATALNLEVIITTKARKPRKPVIDASALTLSSPAVLSARTKRKVAQQMESRKR